jgi:CHAT domain-containing protein
MESDLKRNQLQVMHEIRSFENEMNALEEGESEMYQQLSDSLLHKRFLAFEISYQLKNNSSRYEIEKYGALSSCSDIQENMTDNEAVWICNLIDNQLFNFLVTKDSAYFRFSAYPEEEIQDFYRSVKTGRNNWKEDGQKIYHHLFSHWQNILDDIDHLVVIPDGALNQIAFEALYNDETGRLLIEDMAVSYHYSAWLWNQELKHAKPYSEMTWLGIAPVFSEESDENKPFAYRQNCSEIYRGNGTLKELVYSKNEILELNELLKNKQHQTDYFLYEQASEQQFKESAPHYDIIHIATHGFVSKSDPMLSGLYFSDQQGKELTDDGFMHLGEVFSLDIQSSLVVLSACKSGTGKWLPGDAVQALPRAFIFSGVDNLVVSLWKIQDQNSKDFMINFYQNLEKGMPYYKALQETKIEQIQLGFEPKDWAAMILIGK